MKLLVHCGTRKLWLVVYHLWYSNDIVCRYRLSAQAASINLTML